MHVSKRVEWTALTWLIYAIIQRMHWQWKFESWLLKPEMKAITKTWNGTERPVIFRLLMKIFDLGLGIQKLNFLGLGQGTVWLQRRRVQKRTEWNGPFHSIPFWVLVTTEMDCLPYMCFFLSIKSLFRLRIPKSMYMFLNFYIGQDIIHYDSNMERTGKQCIDCSSPFHQFSNHPLKDKAIVGAC